MKKMSSIISTLIVIIFLTSSCTKNLSCENEKLGDIELSSRADNFTVYTEEMKVSFTNQDGEELIFSNQILSRIGTRINVGEGREGNDLIYGSYTCYDYYQKYKSHNRLTSSDEKIRLDVKVSNESNNIDSNREKVNFDFRHYNQEGEASNVEGHYFYDEQTFAMPPHRNDETKKLEELELNGKIFTEVLSATNEFGSVYFKEYEGVIGFEFIGGDVWMVK